MAVATTKKLIQNRHGPFHRDSEGLSELGLEENAVNIELLVEAVCTQYSVTIDELRSNNKRREIVAARAILARAAQLLRGMELRKVCEILHKPHRSVSGLADGARKNEKLNELANQLVVDLS